MSTHAEQRFLVYRCAHINYILSDYAHPSFAWRFKLVVTICFSSSWLTISQTTPNFQFIKDFQFATIEMTSSHPDLSWPTKKNADSSMSHMSLDSYQLKNIKVASGSFYIASIEKKRKRFISRAEIEFFYHHFVLPYSWKSLLKNEWLKKSRTSVQLGQTIFFIEFFIFFSSNLTVPWDRK